MIQRGDSVEVLDDTLTGIVVEIKGSLAKIETEEGFVMEFPMDKLVKTERFEVNPERLKSALRSELKAQRKSIKRSRKRLEERPMEVDLHMRALPASTRNMSDFDILNYQLAIARRKLEFAIENHIRRVVFIHGVGKGVLRMELEALLRRYEQVESYDADFKKYGRGATEVYIFQNY